MSYANKSHTRIYSLWDQLSRVTKDDKNVAEYLHQIKTISDELATTNSPMATEELTVKILSGLGPKSLRHNSQPRHTDSIRRAIRKNHWPRNFPSTWRKTGILHNHCRRCQQDKCFSHCISQQSPPPQHQRQQPTMERQQPALELQQPLQSTTSVAVPKLQHLH